MVMKEDQLDPQVEKILREVKLKEPKKEEMTNYLSNVRSKIELKQNQSQFPVAPIGIALAVTLALAGLIYFVVPNLSKEEAQIPVISQKSEAPIVPVAPAAVPAQAPTQSFSLEEELDILEAFSEEYPAGTSDLLGDDGVIEDLVLIDEIELNSISSASQSSSFSS